MTPFPELDDNILQEAAEWFAVLQDENLSESTKQRWLTWLNTDPQHQLAWDQIEQITGTFDNINQTETSQAATKALSSSKSGIVSQVAAVCLIAFLIGFTWLFDTSSENPAEAVAYRTEIGETKKLQLSDGTQLWLNSRSAVTTLYTDNLRKIHLTQGEVLVDTAPDNHSTYRPLVVDTPNGRLTALGTRFSVKQQKAITKITVFDGAVSIRPKSLSDELTIPAGKQGQFDHSSIEQQVRLADPAREAWINGILLAEDKPLCEFMAELDSYHSKTIICPNSLNHLELVGTYPLKDTDAILKAVQASLPVQLIQVQDETWRLSPK